MCVNVLVVIFNERCLFGIFFAFNLISFYFLEPNNRVKKERKKDKEGKTNKKERKRSGRCREVRWQRSKGRNAIGRDRGRESKRV